MAHTNKEIIDEIINAYLCHLTGSVDESKFQWSVAALEAFPGWALK